MDQQAPAVLVTGASRGLGRGIALEAARRGYSVIINYAGNREAAEETAELCKKATRDGDDAHREPGGKEQYFPILQGDISSPEDRNRLTEFTFETFSHVAALVNNAGIAPAKRRDMLDLDEESFDRLMAVNLKGPWFLSSLFARRWLEKRERGIRERGARIVFLTSISAETASVNRAEYCLSKAALAMANKLFASRLAGDGIGVYEVRPGIMATDMTSGVTSKYDTLLQEGLVPQQRWGEPADTGRAVAALLQGDFDFSTGNVFYVDGGFHISRL